MLDPTPSRESTPTERLHTWATSDGWPNVERPAAPPTSGLYAPPPTEPPTIEMVATLDHPAPPKKPRRVLKAVAGAVAAVALVATGAAIGVTVADDDDPVAAVSPIVDAETTAPAVEAEDPVATNEGEAPSEPAPTALPDVPGPVADDVAEPAAEVARVLAPAVVRIDTAGGTGSGIFYDESGLLVTNAHVVVGFDEVSVQLADGTRVEGDVVGVDNSVDVAVVRIEPTAGQFETAVFAPTSTVEVGQLAVAIGSPFGLEQSVTAGIVSAVNRVITNTSPVDGSTTIVEMVQTDAPINPGNSGGALADRQGRVVGMNTSIRTDGATQGNLGVGFAIPSDTVILIADRIVAGTNTGNGFLGVGGQDPVVGQPGALVTEVVDNGPAATGGLEVGDLIVAVDGAPVTGMAELAAKVRISAPGTTIAIEVIRDGAPVQLDVELGTLGDS